MQNEKALVRTFHNDQIMQPLLNDNHQLLVGRRGTGKTHILRVLNHGFVQRPKSHSIYIDCRSFGSASLIDDSQKSIEYCCIALFRDFLREIYKGLCNKEFRSSQTVDYMNQFLEAITEVEHITSKVEVERREKGAKSRSKKSRHKFYMDLDKAGSYGFSRDNSTEHHDESEQHNKYNLNIEQSVIFPNLNDSLSRILAEEDIRLYLIIDEWSTIPIKIQPYFAEYLKRGILVCGRITVKIGVISNYDNFRMETEDRTIGLELGSEIANSLNLDSLYTFDINPDRTFKYLLNMIMKHLVAEVGEEHIRTTYGIDPKSRDVTKLLVELFEDQMAWISAFKASEGNARDFINLVGNFMTECHSNGDKAISIETIFSASSYWCTHDKYDQLSANAKALIKRIIAYTCGKHKTRGFFAEEGVCSNRYMQELFSHRMLHMLNSGYTDSNGKRYIIYAIDYGLYVSYLERGEKLTLFKKDLFENVFIHTEDSPQHNDYVRLNSKREIRKVLLPPELIEQPRIAVHA